MLDERLSAVARLVRKDAYFCDVGTDHGYLPCYLVGQGITKRCVACDINIMPLQSAQKQIEQHKMQDYIEVVLSDGLENISSEVQDIAIAGMGGELIAEIIDKCDFIKDSSKHLILQPMTNSPHLRKELYLNGFEILSEIPVIDHNHTYCVIHVRYSGEKKDITRLFSILGKIPESKSNSAITYVERVLDRVSQIVAGLKKSTSEEVDIEGYLGLAKAIEQVREDMISLK